MKLTTCKECKGLTVEFQGRGLDMQYRVCSRWKEPGHKPASDVKVMLAKMTAAHGSQSGRYA